MSSFSNKFDKFLENKSSKNFDPDAYGDEEREVYKSEVVEVGRSSMRSSAAIFDQSTKYKGKKISRKDLFGGLKDSDEEEEMDSSNENIEVVEKTKKNIQGKPGQITDKERALRLEQSLKLMESEGSFSMKEESNDEDESDDEDDESDVEEEEYDDESNEENEIESNSQQTNISKAKVCHNKYNDLEEDDVSEDDDDDDEDDGEKDDEEEDDVENEDEEEDDEDDKENDDDEEEGGVTEHKKASTNITAVIGDSKENTSEALLKQYEILDSFMDIRLSQQETLFKANQLPEPAVYKAFKKAIGSDFNDVVNQINCHFSEILSNVCEFEDYTLKTSGINGKSSKSDDDDAEITSDEDDDDAEDDEDLLNGVNVKKMSIDEEDEVEEGDDEEEDDEDKNTNQKMYTNANKRIRLCHEKLKTNDKEYSAYRVKVLSSLSNKWKFATQSKEQGFSSFYIPIHKQIEQILQDKSRLIERTRVKRSVYNVLGSKENVVTKDEVPTTRKRALDEDTDIFDDGDFYQKLLMEKTKRKIGSANDMTFISKQWAELQRVRKGVKKDVDQRATKGRKTRYEVHKKMVGFMAPCKPKSIASDIQMDAFFEHLTYVHKRQPHKCP